MKLFALYIYKNYKYVLMDNSIGKSERYQNFIYEIKMIAIREKLFRGSRGITLY